MVWDKISSDSIPDRVQESLQQSRWKWESLPNGSRDNEDANDQEAREKFGFVLWNTGVGVRGGRPIYKLMYYIV